MSDSNLLGEFLRARRGTTVPADADVLADTRRRVSGLRREEVAQRAGVSTDYYVRLEQGRERTPSAQVVEALGRALRLDDEALAHLHSLARPKRPRRRPAKERVSPRLVQLMDAWPQTPAVVLGRCMSVLASNLLGEALFAGHEHSGDLLRLVFLDPGARDFYPDWERVAVNTVGGLRSAAGTDLDDPLLIEAVGELSLKSADFRRLWARHDLRQKTRESKRFRHPLVGMLALHYESMTVNSASGQQLVVYQADPGSPSEAALGLLGSLAAGDRPHR